jgi:hypothetical protein
MKRVMLLVLTVLLVSLLLTASTKPPRTVRLEIKNVAGEPIVLEMTGTGYDFKENSHIWPGGAYYWLSHQDPPINPATKEYMNVPSFGRYTLPTDRYVIEVHYAQEIADNSITCLMNWVPDGFENGTAYFDLDRNRKLTIPACDQIPKVLPGHKNNAVKWARWLFIVK